MPHYLTFINSRDQKLNQLLTQYAAVKCAGLYDFVVATNDAQSLIESIGQFDCASVTLIAPRREFGDDAPLFLANVKGLDRSNPLKATGCYNFVGREDEVDPQSVTGWLRLELESRVTPRDGKFIPMSGRHYRPARIERGATPEEAQAYINGCREISAYIDSYNPTLIYAPARGAKPIVDTALRFAEKPYPLYYPVTSSFVRGGRQNNPKEIAAIFNDRPDMAARLMYVEEIVSGGMTWGHYREMLAAETERSTTHPIQIKAAGLVHEDGARMNKTLRGRFGNFQRRGDFLLQFVPNVFTLDDNRQLCTHYLQYQLGPHNVPYGDFQDSILGQVLGAAS